MKLISVIVTYNRVEKLKIALSHMLNSKITSIVVVNNASTDTTKEYLSDLDDRVHVINMPENIGGAGGFYEGVKYVHTEIKDYDWIVVSDDDAYAQDGTIDRFMETEHFEDIDGYMSAVYYPNGNICNMNIPGYHPFKDKSQTVKTFLKGGNSFHIDKSLFASDRKKKVDFASFVGLFFSKSVVNKIKFPDKEWFIYGDDLDYTLKMTSSGFNIYFDPNLKFVHDCDTLENNKKIYSPIWKVYFTYRNGLIIYKKLSGNFFPLVLLGKVVQWYGQVIYYENKKEYLKLVTIAIVDGLKNDRSKKLKDIAS